MIAAAQISGIDQTKIQRGHAKSELGAVASQSATDEELQFQPNVSK